MAVNSQTVLIPETVKLGLHDRSAEKRKLACIEFEGIVLKLDEENREHNISDIINELSIEYLANTHPNSRKGGLLAVSSLAVSLSREEVFYHMDQLLQQVIRRCDDPDHNVRLVAAEAFYNLAHVLRRELMPYLSKVLHFLAFMSVDPHVSVREAGETIDRLVKDVLQEAWAACDVSQENMDGLIKHFAEKLSTRLNESQWFYLDWLTFFQTLPQVDLISPLPLILSGLLKMLYDQSNPKPPSRDKKARRPKGESEKKENDTEKPDGKDGDEKPSDELKKEKEKERPEEDGEDQSKLKLHAELFAAIKVFLDEMLGEIKQSSATWKELKHQWKLHLIEKNPNLAKKDINMLTIEEPVDLQCTGALKPPLVHWGKLVEVLAWFGCPHDEKLAMIILRWLDAIVSLEGETLFDYLSQIFSVTLVQLSHTREAIKTLASALNERLEVLYTTTANHVTIIDCLDILKKQIETTNLAVEESQLAALRWVNILCSNCDGKAHQSAFPSVSPVRESKEDFLKISPSLLVALASPSERVGLLVIKLLSRWSSNIHTIVFQIIQKIKQTRELVSRLPFIVQALCIELDAEEIFKSFAQILEGEEDLFFATTMVQKLNGIFLMSKETEKIREKLINLTETSSCATFEILYRAWVHDHTSLFSLCLLVQVYEHASTLLFQFGNIEMTKSKIAQIESLVELIEINNIFYQLKGHLQRPLQYPHLYKCLYGWLMLMPQGKAFQTLQDRLNMIDIPCIELGTNYASVVNNKRLNVNFEALWQHFCEIQQRHNKFIWKKWKEDEEKRKYTPPTAPEKLTKKRFYTFEEL